VFGGVTSMLGSFPLRAMGPFQLDDSVKRGFSGSYIPSYPQALFALIEFGKSGRSLSEKYCLWQTPMNGFYSFSHFVSWDLGARLHSGFMGAVALL
jgi:hypothetical protein